MDRPDLRSEVGFSQRAAVDISDELVFYAVPQRKIVGLARVASHPILQPQHERWPWRCKIDLKVAIVDPVRALDLDDIAQPGGRDLAKSVQRRSHMKLHWAEYQRARDGLTRVCDATLGDLCG